MSKILLSPFTVLTTFFALIMTSVFVAAQAIEIPADPTTIVDVIGSLSALIGGAKGATTLAIVALASQFLAKFVLSPLWDSLKLDVKYKFVVFGLTQLVASVVPLMIQGQSFLQAISSGAVLLLIVQYGHRIYELFIEKK